jgi:hypothetical protein
MRSAWWLIRKRGTLPSQKGAEPERAFRGEARSAFAWLNCILTEEHDCLESVQPALEARASACELRGDSDESDCRLRVQHRFVTVASQLAGARSGFQCWLNALETAVCEDPFWGDVVALTDELLHALSQTSGALLDIWPEGIAPEGVFADGCLVQELVRQCYELSATLDNPARATPSLAKTPMPVYGSRCLTVCEQFHKTEERYLCSSRVRRTCFRAKLEGFRGNPR